MLCIVCYTVTAWKVSKYGVFLVRIFLYSDWIRRFTPYLETFHSAYFPIRWNMMHTVKLKKLFSLRIVWDVFGFAFFRDYQQVFFLFSIIFCSEKFTKMGWFLRFTQPTFTCSTPMFLSIIFIVNFEQISHYFTRLLWLFHCWLWTGKFRLGTGNSWYFHWLENFWLPVNLKTQSFFRKVNWPKNSRNHDIFFAVVISKHETFTTHSSKT